MCFNLHVNKWWPNQAPGLEILEAILHHFIFHISSRPNHIDDNDNWDRNWSKYLGDIVHFCKFECYAQAAKKRWNEGAGARKWRNLHRSVFGIYSGRKGFEGLRYISQRLLAGKVPHRKTWVPVTQSGQFACIIFQS